jgi:hypothetical protein
MLLAALAPQPLPSTGRPPFSDTLTLYGPRVFSTPTGSAAYHVEAFSLAVHAGRTYLLKVENGASDGSLRVSGGSVTLNGVEVLSNANTR